MKKIIISIVSAAFSVVFLCTAVFAADYKIDVPDGTLTSTELQVLEDSAQQAAQETGFNIVLLVSNDVGSDKSDRGVVDYADVYYENVFGKNTDGILLLINDDTKYDYISTSGVCINYFTDRRIDNMFTYFTDYIYDGNYYGAMKEFLNQVTKNYHNGIPSNQYTVDVDAEQTQRIVTGVLVGSIAGLIFAFIFYRSVSGRYKKIKPYQRSSYIEAGKSRFTESRTQYVRSYTVSTQSSSSGGRGGGGGRSSSHHSSGGGSHGGGGHHR